MRCRSSTDEPAAANEAEAWDWGFVAWDSLTLINVDPLSSIAFSELCFLKRPNQTRGAYEIILVASNYKDMIYRSYRS